MEEIKINFEPNLIQIDDSIKLDSKLIVTFNSFNKNEILSNIVTESIIQNRLKEQIISSLFVEICKYFNTKLNYIDNTDDFNLFKNYFEYKNILFVNCSYEIYNQYYDISAYNSCITENTFSPSSSYKDKLIYQFRTDFNLKNNIILIDKIILNYKLVKNIEKYDNKTITKLTLYYGLEIKDFENIHVFYDKEDPEYKRWKRCEKLKQLS